MRRVAAEKARSMTLDKIANEVFILWIGTWAMLLLIGIVLEHKLKKVLDAIEKLREP